MQAHSPPVPATPAFLTLMISCARKLLSHTLDVTFFGETVAPVDLWPPIRAHAAVLRRAACAGAPGVPAATPQLVGGRLLQGALGRFPHRASDRRKSKRAARLTRVSQASLPQRRDHYALAPRHAGGGAAGAAAEWKAATAVQLPWSPPAPFRSALRGPDAKAFDAQLARVIVKVFARWQETASPGKLRAGMTLENVVLDRSAWRHLLHYYQGRIDFVAKHPEWFRLTQSPGGLSIHQVRRGAF